MNSGCRNSGSSAIVSQADWCLDATSSGPFGIFSSPRYSTLMLQNTRSIQIMLRDHDFASLMNACRGSKECRDRDHHVDQQRQIESDVEDERAEKDGDHRHSSVAAPRRACATPRSAGDMAAGSVETQSSICTRNTCGEEFGIFGHQQPRRRAARPPWLVPPLFADHRKRDQQHVRHACAKFDDGARHVIVRRHHDQRAEAALLAQRRVSAALPRVLTAE